MHSITDAFFLKKALALAEIRRGFCSPNPSVGAIVVKNNVILSEGFHFQAGDPHAEVNALNKLTSDEASGSTVYVSLEPCNHWGRTPPCTQKIIESGIIRVVYGARDVNLDVDGNGAELLRQSGVICEHLVLPEIEDFYKSYKFWQANKMPLVTAKLAVSVDGKIAGEEGKRIEITGEAMGKFTHQSRKKHDAILTTAKTIVNDNPSLNVRLLNETLSKPIYILDSHLNLPLDANIFQTALSITVFYERNASSQRLQDLIQLGVRCIPIENSENGLILKNVLQEIGKDGVHDLWVEAGGRCFSALAEQNLLHRAYIYIALKSFSFGTDAFPRGLHLGHKKFHTFRQVGDDVLCEIHW